MFERTTDTKAVDRRWSVKKMFLKILQNSQKNTCTKVRISFRLSFHRTPPVAVSANTLLQFTYELNSTHERQSYDLHDPCECFIYTQLQSKLCIRSIIFGKNLKLVTEIFCENLMKIFNPRNLIVLPGITRFNEKLRCKQYISL